MNLKNLNLGTPLTREQQKKITGGDTICPLGSYVQCDCVDNTIVYYPSDGITTEYNTCYQNGACDWIIPGGLDGAFCAYI